MGDNLAAMSPSRRDFLGVLTGAVAAPLIGRPSGWAHVFTGAQQAADERKIGYCIVGLGRISMGQFMPAVKASAQRSKLVALVSGHRDKAERVAHEYGVPLESVYNYQ